MHFVDCWVGSLGGCALRFCVDWFLLLMIGCGLLIGCLWGLGTLDFLVYTAFQVWVWCLWISDLLCVLGLIKVFCVLTIVVGLG